MAELANHLLVARKTRGLTSPRPPQNPAALSHRRCIRPGRVRRPLPAQPMRQHLIRRPITRPKGQKKSQRAEFIHPTRWHPASTHFFQGSGRSSARSACISRSARRDRAHPERPDLSWVTILRLRPFLTRVTVRGRFGRNRRVNREPRRASLRTPAPHPEQKLGTWTARINMLPCLQVRSTIQLEMQPH